MENPLPECLGVPRPRLRVALEYGLPALVYVLG
jgi:hypothetical protein